MEKSIKISEDTYTKLVEHKKKTGISIKFLVDLAVKKIIENSRKKS